MSSKKSEMWRITKEIINCKNCPLWRSRKNPVIGEGDLDTKLMLISEAPGRNEDLQGKPFVGAAGKILDEVLNKVGLKRSEIYIANILKCRPPNNRTPKTEEINACVPYLNRQILIIKPKIICTMGNVSSKYILEKFGLKHESMGRMRGKIFNVNTLFGKLKIIPTYHPAAAVYTPGVKDLLMEDFKKVINCL